MKKQTSKPKGAFWWLVKFGLLYFSTFFFFWSLVSKTYVDYAYHLRKDISLLGILIYNFKKMLYPEILILYAIFGLFVGFILFFLIDYLFLTVLQKRLTDKKK
jgi:hypothetical protein